jgi:flagellar motor switch protein FliG
MALLTRLKGMNDSQIQDWLRKVGQENAAKLAVAMLGVDEDVRKMIYRNMSQRAAAHLQDDVDNNKNAAVNEKTISNYSVELEKFI